MLRSVTGLRGDVVLARDGDMGFVVDVYFDDQQWNVRYLVVETRDLTPEHRVLITPQAVMPGQPADELVRVRLTCQEVERSPDVDAALPVALQLDSRVPWEKRDPHLRSSEVVLGYHVQALDGLAGRVSDLLIDGAKWSIERLVVDTGKGLPGPRVLLAPQAVRRIEWPWRKVHVALSRDEVRNSPRA
jgi:hypothetical protein